MREFNIFGPVYSNRHYYLDRQEVKQQLHNKIEKGRYFTLNAARQMGKTTFLQEIVNEQEKHGTYFAVLLDFQALAYFEQPEFYKYMGLMIERWRKHYEPSAPVASNMRDHGDFLEWLRKTTTTLGKPGILIIDEFEAVSPDLFTPLLTQFRSMYLARENPYEYALQSIILTGVHTIASLLEGTQSPFNVADQFTVPYFSFDESKALLEQHTVETGQRFEADTIQGIYEQSQGQPFLVNRLGKMLTEKIAPMPNTIEPTNEAVEQYTVTATHFERAMFRLLNEDNTHFYTITSKSKPHRAFLLPMLFYNQFKTNFREEVTSELLMFGVLRVIEDQHGFQEARIANPIYQKVLLLTFAPNIDEVYQPNGTIRYRYLVDGILDFAGLLDSFKAFMTEHGVRLLKSAKTGRPLELSGQYLLLSFLTASLNSIQGSVTIESMSDAGEMDILAFFKGKRFIIETKVWYGPSHFEAAKTQLTNYLRATGLDTGHLVIFDEKLASNSLVETNGERFSITHEDKQLEIYFVPVQVI